MRSGQLLLGLLSWLLDHYRTLCALLDRTGLIGLTQAVYSRQDGGEEVFIVGLQHFWLTLNQEQGVS